MTKFLGVAADEVDALKVKSGLTIGTGLLSVSTAFLARVATTLTPASVAANTMIDQVFAIPGIKAGDFVGITPPLLVPGVTAVCARATIDNSITVTFVNTTAGDLVPGAGVYKLLIVR